MGLQISTEYWILWILDIRTSLRFKKCHSEYASNILKSAIRSTLITRKSQANIIKLYIINVWFGNHVISQY